MPSPNVSKPLRKHLVPIASLSADPANARLHDQRSIDAIANSLKRFGQQKPIVCDAAGVTVAGAGLLAAALQLGWTHVAAVHSQLSGAERVAYGIADNRTAELSTWDEDALRALVGSMPEDMAAASGYTQDELQQLLAGDDEHGVHQDEIPEPAKVAVSKLGDVWILGKHRLMCGDCTKPADVAALMQREKAALFATDPPYLVDYDGTNHPQSFTSGKNNNKDWSQTYGTTWDDADGNTDLYDRFIAAAVPHLRENAPWYCWHASRRQAMLEAAWVKAGAFVHCQIIWAKNRPVLTRTWYMWQHEPCLMGWIKNKKPPRMEDAEKRSTVWEFDTLANTEDRPDHPTPKPVELFAIPIEQHTNVGEICYEPFSGSGTQIIAAEQLRRRCFAIDIQPQYIDVAIRRWQSLTGKEAVLDGTKRTWAAVAKARGVSMDGSCAPPPRVSAEVPAETPSPATVGAGSTPKRARRRPAQGSKARAAPC